MKKLRKNGRECLQDILKDKKSVKILEKKTYKLSNKNISTYKNIIFQLCNDLNDGEDIKNLLIKLQNNEFLFDHLSFSLIKKELDEQDDFITNPFEIEEGVLQCNKCDSRKTFSYPLQTRSGDEKTSVFACCAQCGAKWVT